MKVVVLICFIVMSSIVKSVPNPGYKLSAGKYTARSCDGPEGPTACNDLQPAHHCYYPSPIPHKTEGAICVQTCTSSAQCENLNNPVQHHCLTTVHPHHCVDHA